MFTLKLRTFYYKMLSEKDIICSLRLLRHLCIKSNKDLFSSLSKSILRELQDQKEFRLINQEKQKPGKNDEKHID